MTAGAGPRSPYAVDIFSFEAAEQVVKQSEVERQIIDSARERLGL
jgi:hypothetical protein